MKRKLLATLLALCLIVGMIPVAASANSMTDCPGGDTCTHAAAIGNTHYDTLQEAVEAVQDKGTITLLQDTEGSGIGTFKDGTSSGKIPVKNFTIDFATHTYTCIGPAVGSAGTQSQAFHLEWNGNAENNVKVTLKNGTITSAANSGVVMLVQNYCDLTLDHMTLDGSNLPAAQYTSSNNCGNVVIRDTTIIAPTNGVAFDVCDYASYTGVSVTVEGNSSIRGKVEVVNDNGDKNNASLSVKDGVFTTDVVGTSYEGATAPLTNYLAEDVTLVENSDGTFAVEPLNAENAVAQVGTQYFNSLKAAIDNASEGDTVTLLHNYEVTTAENTEYNLPDNSILDLGGHTLTVPYMAAIFQGNNVSIQNGTFDSNADYPLFIGNGTEETNITIKNIDVNGGINVYVATVTLVDVNANVGDKTYHAVWGDEGSNITIQSGAYTANPSESSSWAVYVFGGDDSDGTEDGPDDHGKITILGGDISGKIGINNLEEGAEGCLTVSGGYFTSDPSEYVSEGYIAGDSDNSSYTYQVVEKTNSETPAEVVPAAPVVDTGDLSTEEATAVSNALSGVEAELTAAANTQADQNTVTNDEAENALADASINTSGEDVTVVIQPYLDIAVKDYNTAGATKVLSLDITPMYRTVATTVDVENNPDDIKVKGDAGVTSDANAVVISNQGGILPVKGAVEISIPLPSGFVSGTENIYVQHKDIYEYTATVTVAANVYTATFTNPHGFSEFTFTTDSQAVATIGSTSYTSLQAAVDDATSDDIIVIIKDTGALSATANKTVKVMNGTEKDSIDVTINGVSKTIEKEKTETFVYTSGGGTPSEPEEPTWPFTDVTEGDDWFYDAVAYVYENGIMAGTDETTFEPFLELDRAMAAQLFYNLEGQPTVTGDSTFTDVTSGHWAVDAITWAAQNDIVAGIGGGLYDPDSNVTREQFAVMLYKYARFKGYDLTATGDLTQFPDADAISSWAETALSWANGKGLINGHENGTIDPKGSTIRAQAASIMANFDQNVAK